MAEIVIVTQEKIAFLMAIEKGITHHGRNGKSKKVSNYYNI
jgi:hypothetical protein